MGNDTFVDAAESASFPLPGTGKREGGEKTQPSIASLPTLLLLFYTNKPNINPNLNLTCRRGYVMKPREGASQGRGRDTVHRLSPANPDSQTGIFSLKHESSIFRSFI